MDVLTDLLRGLRSRNEIYGRLELSAPWGLRVSRLSRLSFYAVSRGSAVLSSKETALQLVAGDIVLIQKDVEHTLKDHLRTRAASISEVFGRADGTCGGLVPYGGGGTGTTIIAGGFSFETTALEPLVANLPPIIHVRSDGPEAANRLEPMLQFMASELRAEAPGYELVASRLADVLFIHALRTHVEDGLCKSSNWLQAIADPKLSTAFQRMHEQPSEPWTVDTLAKAASMSRSAFAARFTDILGLSPLSYLTRWRMHRAAEMLVGEPVKVNDIAARVGYETESAFIKVFKRHFGETPATYRRRRAAA